MKAPGDWSPEAVVATVWRRIRPEWIVCFCSAMAFGFAAHAYKLVNWLPNWDSLVFRHGVQNMTHLGRWFLAVACLPSSNYDLPWICGAFALAYVSVAAVCVCRIFGIRKKLPAALVGALLTTFPTISSTLAYNYVADGYALSFLLAVLAAWAFDARGVRAFLLGVLSLTLSLGIYQAYVSVAMTILLALQVKGLVFDRERARTSLRRAARFLLGGVLASVAYLVALRLSLSLEHAELSAYLWADDGNVWLAPGYLPRVLRASARTLVSFFFNLRWGITPHAVVGALAFASAAGLLLRAAARAGVFRSLPRTALFFAYSAVAPLCATPLLFLNPDTHYHNLMTMGYSTLAVFLVLFYERRTFDGPRFEAAKKWLVAGLGALLVYDYVLIANVGCHKLQLAFLSSYGEAVRMADRIEQTPGAPGCRTLAVLGVKPDSAAWSSFANLDLTGVTDGSLLRPDDYTVNQSVVTATLNDYCQKKFAFATVEERRRLAADPRVRRMPLWPEPGSIAVIDGFLVLRLGEGSGLYD